MSLKLFLRRLINGNWFLFRVKQELDIYLTGAFRLDVSKSWSEYGEDQILADELREYLNSGYYLDCGANHPTKGSNTFKLYCMGMRGITIEPNPTLSRLHSKYRPGDIQLTAAAGESNGVAVFYNMATHGLSTLSKDYCDQLIASGHHLLSQSLIPILTLGTVLGGCVIPGRPILALLSIDVESMDESLLRTSDWLKHRPKLIVFERSGALGLLGDYLNECGYDLIAVRGCNNIMRRRG